MKYLNLSTNMKKNIFTQKNLYWLLFAFLFLVTIFSGFVQFFNVKIWSDFEVFMTITAKYLISNESFCMFEESMVILIFWGSFALLFVKELWY